MPFEPSAGCLHAALLHARACMPMESCGLVIGGSFFAVTNTAGEESNFVMNMVEVIALEAAYGKMEAVVHSHVYQPAVASEADQAMCEKTAVPWLIVSVPLNTHCVIEPCGYIAPLIGRQWAWGTMDCYGLVRDAYKVMGGIEIPDFQREWMWWENGGDIIGSQFQDAGFIPLSVDADFQHLDVVGMQVRCDVVNHLGVWLQGDYLLHQLMGRVSARQPYGGFFKSVTALHLRHRELMA
jgi:proteasome lid subunit RPN8/RPN11